MRPANEVSRSYDVVKCTGSFASLAVPPLRPPAPTQTLATAIVTQWTQRRNASAPAAAWPVHVCFTRFVHPGGIAVPLVELFPLMLRDLAVYCSKRLVRSY